MTEERVIHPLKPVFDQQSRVLILGTMPSPGSRAAGFYYSHPRNRFWPVLGRVLGETVPDDPAGRRDFCLRHRVALWDVLASCTIKGAADGSIKDPVANPIEELLAAAEIRQIFTTGRKAYDLYQKYCYPHTGRAATLLPSTSPANCACSLERLVEAYRAIGEAVR